ncbi:hypothetical protein PUR61_00830, partial [Streptomyces sp. BE20]|uniref:hypothetical protein n=1 Tax=Streptomyces sp. BE20 TaxID=3002525 RepID=UPI002E76732C
MGFFLCFYVGFCVGFFFFFWCGGGRGGGCIGGGGGWGGRGAVGGSGAFPVRPGASAHAPTKAAAHRTDDDPVTIQVPP